MNRYCYSFSYKVTAYIAHILALVCIVCFVASESLAIPKNEEDLLAIANNLTDTSIKHGDIPSISQPKYVSIYDADLTLEDNDTVFIVFIPGSQPRIYPQKIMVWHEVVNDFVDGKAYAITYSPISGSMAAYEAQIDDINLIFDNEGKLFNSTSVLIDRNTGSLWSQILGIAFDGPLKGRGLTYLVSWWSTWDKAKHMYPNALVLTAPSKAKKPYGRDPYGSYSSMSSYYNDERILYPVTYKDDRLHPKAKILGLELEGLPLAIDEAYIKEKKVVNFFSGPYALAAIFDPRLNIVRVFSRTVWNKQLLLTVNQQGLPIDVETKTVWNYDGLAINGKLKDASMSEIFGINTFWFSWYTFHPESLLIPGPTVVPDSALIKNNT